MDLTESKSKKQPLFTKDFTLVLIGQIISLFGNNILRFALPMHIFFLTGSEQLLGVVSASAFIPMIIMSPLGGILADRVNKQRIMVVLDFCTAALCLVFLFLLDAVSPLPLFIVTLMVLFAIQGAYTPAVQASLPALAKGENLMPANAAVNLVNSLSSLIGPILGGIMYSQMGLIPIVILGGVSFFISAVMELFIRIPFIKQDSEKSMWSTVESDLRIGLRFIFKENPIVLPVLGIVFAVNLFMSAMIGVGLLPLVTKTLRLSTELYGICQGVLAAGGLLGGILAGVVGNKLPLQKVWLLLLACGVGLFPMGIVFLLPVPPFAAYLVLTASSFVMMVCATMFSIKMLAFVQSISPEAIVGKVIAIVMAVSISAQPLGQVLFGTLFQKLQGMPWIVILGSAIITTVVSLFSKSTFARLD